MKRARIDLGEMCGMEERNVAHVPVSMERKG